nr:N-acetyltransferase family protein [uncultured Cohaesibacter sp.]
MPSPRAPSLDETSEYSGSDVVIRPICTADQAAILDIYQQGIESGNATFTAQAPDWAGWDRGHLEPCRLVATIAGDVVGWAALSAYSSREVYRGVAELSIYIANQAKGRHVGSLLLGHLVDLSEQAGFWPFRRAFFPIMLRASSCMRNSVFVWSGSGKGSRRCPMARTRGAGAMFHFMKDAA